jgi:hypothetical protein
MGIHMTIISLLLVVEGQQLKSPRNQLISSRQIDCQNVSEIMTLVIATDNFSKYIEKIERDRNLHIT